MNDSAIDTGPEPSPRTPRDGGPIFRVSRRKAREAAQNAANQFNLETMPGSPIGEIEAARSKAYSETFASLIGGGLTVRDYMAIHASAHEIGVVTSERPHLSLPDARYAWADAMLAARVKS